MSKINRSTYQKLHEEYKRLKANIEVLVMQDDMAVYAEVFNKWYNQFSQEREFNQLLKDHAKQYIEDHKDELPDFLTNKIE